MSVCRSNHFVARVLSSLSLAAVVFGGSAVLVAPPAQAAVVTAGVPAAVTARALSVAATKRGAPYRAGGVGPASFDCSGYTAWVYARVGRTLVHSAQAQFNATIRVSRAQARKGDLVFVMDGRGRTGHVGVFAGGNLMWHSPKAGDRVKLAVIWTSAVAFGRVR